MIEWLSIAQAAIVVGKHERTIYRWIRKGRLASRSAVDGALEVKSTDVVRVESETHRGRPQGVPTRR